MLGGFCILMYMHVKNIFLVFGLLGVILFGAWYVFTEGPASRERMPSGEAYKNIMYRIEERNVTFSNGFSEEFIANE